MPPTASDDDPIERLSAERDKNITDIVAEASSLIHRLTAEFSMTPQEAVQAILDFYSASLDDA